MDKKTIAQNVGVAVGVMLGVSAIGATLGSSCMIGGYWTQRGLVGAEKAAADFGKSDVAATAPNLDVPKTYATFDTTRVSIQSREQPEKTLDDVAELLASQPGVPASIPKPGRNVEIKGTVISRNVVKDEDGGTLEDARKLGEQLQEEMKRDTEKFKLENDANYRAKHPEQAPPTRTTPASLSEEQKEQLKNYVDSQHEAIEQDHKRRGIVESDDDKRFS